MHRTQFDAQLLRESVGSSPPIISNHGRHVSIDADGSVRTALAWGGATPTLRLWRGYELTASHEPNGQPSAPCALDDGGVWLSVNDVLMRCDDDEPPTAIDVRGRLLDAARIDDVTVLAVLRAAALHLIWWNRRVLADVCVDADAGGGASLAVDDSGQIHLVYEQFRGLEYRVFAAPGADPVVRQRPAGAFAQMPIILTQEKTVVIAYLGEHGAIPEEDAQYWAAKPWSRRIGVGGFVAALVSTAGSEWRRIALADSKQFAKPLWPKSSTWGYDYPNVDVRPRMEQFSAPALSIGPDGVITGLWANLSRRWIYSSRLLGDDFSPAIEIRGPLEQLLGPPLLPTACHDDSTDLPIVIPTATRCYLDRIKYPSREVTRGRRIDFVQLDELAVCRGMEIAVNTMQRHEGNPVIRTGPLGSHDDAGLAGRIDRDGDGWIASIVSKQTGRKWRHEVPVRSADGIHWPRSEHIARDETYLVDGQSLAKVFTDIEHVRDDREPDPQRRFKGLWMNPAHGWGGYTPVTSPDTIHWTSVGDATEFPVSDGIYIWIDDAEIPARRFKAIGSSRSFCGRVCAQFVSADGMHWRDVRDTLDFHNPFGSERYWSRTYPAGEGTGRILIDPWAGPEDEDELHGGYVFREGERWLCHYMKWSPDGHIYCALASSRNGINFSRVGGGAATLPLGSPGTWDSGRIALHNPPALINNVWRQYYVGSGWKHGFEGSGPAPHPTSGKCGIYSPTQIGFAEIARGRWAQLWLSRHADAGELVTIPLHLRVPHRISLDVEGLSRWESSIQLAVLDARTWTPLEGFDFAQCNEITRDSPRQEVRWRGKPLFPGEIRLAARLRGHLLRLYGLTADPI